MLLALSQIHTQVAGGFASWPLCNALVAGNVQEEKLSEWVEWTAGEPGCGVTQSGRLQQGPILRTCVALMWTKREGANLGSPERFVSWRHSDVRFPLSYGAPTRCQARLAAASEQRSLCKAALRQAEPPLQKLNAAVPSPPPPAALPGVYAPSTPPAEDVPIISSCHKDG
ncbi:hypothetical protein UY3_12951 [Chelonia mydas]|uniref:Uncharacterized protein n=1 Tax=Chelonia mydas TaxID=8469 RepID=M7AYY5_CHEMY|nr:hypothetical protein UY3_12951 [Chelonia mydas]